MAREYFVPKNDAEYRKNHGIYTAQLSAPDSVYVAKYDISGADVAQAVDDDARLSAGDTLINSLRAQLTKAEGDQEALKTEVTAHWAENAGFIKRNKKFVDADGEALKILGPEISDDYSEKNPKIRLEITPEGVKVMFTKFGGDGINLYCQRSGDAGPQFVRFISKSGWIDGRPNANVGQDESRQYSGYIVVSDHEVGQISLPAPISVKPRA